MVLESQSQQPCGLMAAETSAKSQVVKTEKCMPNAHIVSKHLS